MSFPDFGAEALEIRRRILAKATGLGRTYHRTAGVDETAEEGRARITGWGRAAVSGDAS